MKLLCKNAKRRALSARLLNVNIKCRKHDSNTVAVSNSANWRIFRRSHTQYTFDAEFNYIEKRQETSLFSWFVSPILASRTIGVCHCWYQLSTLIRFGSTWMTFIMWYVLYHILCSNESNKHLDSVTYIYIQMICINVFRRYFAICTILWICECLDCARESKSDRHKMCGK